MSEDKKIVYPKYIKDLEDISFTNQELEKLRKELLSVAKAMMEPIAVQWVDVEETSKSLKEEADHPAFADMEWKMHAYSLMKSIRYYKQLKEGEVTKYAEFIVKLAKELKGFEKAPEIKEQPVEDDIRKKMRALIEKEPELSIRFNENSDRSIQGELNKLFGEEYCGIIDEMTTEEENENGQHS